MPSPQLAFTAPHLAGRFENWLRLDFHTRLTPAAVMRHSDDDIEKLATLKTIWCQMLIALDS